MSKRQNKNRLGHEMSSPDGKEDAFIHDEILDNPEADKAFRDETILRVVADGMSVEKAYELYGDKPMSALTEESGADFAVGFTVISPQEPPKPEKSMNTDSTVLSHLAGKFTIQTENLASEALAFILQRSVAARTALRTLADQFGCPCPDDLTFETQLSNDDGARPDVIGKSPDGKVRLIIEAKFWAGLTDSQPVSYLEKSLPSTGGILLFIAPEKRLYTLWSELSRRVGYPLKQPTTQGPNRYCIRVGSNVLALTSWRLLSETLIRQVDHAGDFKCVADLKQLVGLCNQMDTNAFLPLTSEEMTSTLGQRIVQFCDLANVLTEQLVSEGHGNVKGLKASAGHGWYGRYLWLKGYGAVIQFSAWNWSKWGASPLWLGVKGENWERSAKVRDAMVRFSIEFREDDKHDYCFVPIHLTTGVEREKVIADALDQLMRVVEALPPSVSALTTKPPPSELMQTGDDESVRES